MRNYFLLIVIFSSLIFFQSCEKEPISPTDNPQGLVAPDIPPLEMYSMPTKALEKTDSDTTATGQTTGVSYRNWIHAGLNLLVWNTVVVLNMALPVNAFGNALNQEAVYIGDSTFEWVYQYEADAALGGKTYDISLQGKYINNTQEVEWTMTASEVGGFTDFVWYTGVVATDGSKGNFILNRHPNNSQPYLGIAYNRDSNGNTATRFTNIIPNHNENGHYIEYRAELDGEYNRAFDLQGAANNFLEIRWNEPGGDGQVRHPLHFNDDEWHCWNTDQMDVDC